MRILSGMMLLYTHLVWGLALEAFFGPDGWQDPLLVATRQQESGAWSLLWFVPPEHLRTFHYAGLAVIGCYTVGLFTRVTSIAAWIVAVSYINRAPMANFGLDQVNSMILLYLCLAPCGAAFSVDRLWQAYRCRRADRPVPRPAATVMTRVATRLLQVHVAVLYLFAGLSKLKGQTWWTGDAVWLGAANYEYQSGSLEWLAWHPLLVNFLTHATVFFEISFCVFVWMRPLRPIVLLGGTMLHLGIGGFLGMWTFGLAMILTYVSFLPPEWIASADTNPPPPGPPGPPAKSREEGLSASSAVVSSESSHPVSREAVLHLGLLPIGLALLLAGCGVEGSARGSAGDQLLERGRMFVGREDYPKAIAALTEGLGAAPADADLLYERGIAYERSGQLDAALADYTAAVAARPGFARAMNNEAAIHARQGRLVAAVEGFGRVLERDPADALALRNRAQALLDLMRFEEAEKDLLRSIELDPAAPEPWHQLGLVRERAGQVEKAIEAFSAALRLNPLSAESWQKRGELYRRLGREGEARHDLARAAEIKPALELGVEEMPVLPVEEIAPLPVEPKPIDEIPIPKS